MAQQELLARVVAVLDAARVPYMLTRSLVSSAQGQPRATHDIDLVVSITPAATVALLRAFPPPDFYLDEGAMNDAVARRSSFNLLDVAGGDKVHFWLLTDDPFDRSRFSRRRPELVDNINVVASTPEDTILQKLHWAELSGGSEKQFKDALSVYELQSPHIDEGYLDRWATALNVGPLLTRLRREARP